MAIRLTVSKIDIGQRSEGSGDSEIDYNLLKCNSGLCIGLLLNLNVY